jgi:hypothetical protein
LDEFDRCGDPLPVGKPAPQVGVRARPGQLAELAVEVRLVVVPAAKRDLGEPAAVVTAEQRHRPAKSQNARGGLGRRPDLLAEAGRQVPPAASQLLGQAADRQPASGFPQPPPGPGHVRRGPARRFDAGAHEGVDQLEPSRPIGRLEEPLGEEPRRRAEQVLERHDRPRQLTHRRSEQHVRAERG